MDGKIKKEMERFSETVEDANEEIDLASEEGTPLEDIEGAKTLAADLIHKYESFLNRLEPDDKVEVQQKIGLVIERIKSKLVQLKEAPE